MWQGPVDGSVGVGMHIFLRLLLFYTQCVLRVLCFGVMCRDEIVIYYLSVHIMIKCTITN